MNKYKKFYNKKFNKTKLVFDELLMEFMINNLKYKVNDKIYKVNDKKYLYMIFNLSKYDYEVKNNIKKLISKCDKSFIYMIYIEAINYLLCKVKSKNSVNILFDLKTIEDSFIETGLVKKISHEKDYNYKLELVLPNNDVVMVKPCIINQNEIDNISDECHNFSRFMLNYDVYKNNYDVMICTGFIKSLFGRKLYHTIIVDQGIAMDFVNNIQMPLEDYINIFDFDIINMQDKISFFATLNMLNYDDIEFKDSNLSEPLKCALNKQMNEKTLKS